MGIAAVNTGNNLLYLVVSAMLSFMAVSGLLGWMNIRGISVRFQVPDELYAGMETLASVTVENSKRLLPSFLVSITVAGHSAPFIMVDRRGTHQGSLLLSFDRRGRHAISTARISSPFPVNFFVRFRTVAVAESFTVFPTPRPCGTLFGSGKPDAGQLGESTQKGYEGELAKISDYTGGESLRQIHWRLSAKHEVFKVKELTATTDQPVVLELDRVPGRNLEERLSSCCYLVNRMVKGGRPVGLKLGERVIAPSTSRSHRLKLLAELALYGQD
ncbi:hypothetical protein GMSM_43590 [Geomonas sp. Red276]